MTGREFSFLFAAFPILISGVGPVSAAEREPVALSPIGPWQLDMGEDRCRLARLFGSDEEKTVFILDQWGPSVSAQWAVAGPMVRDVRVTGRAGFQFGPGGDSEDFRYTGASLGDYGAVVAGETTVAARPDAERGEDERDWLTEPRGLPALDAASAASVDSLFIDQRGSASFTLGLGGMEKPLRAFNLCMEKLVESWGFDVEEQREVATPPRITNMDLVAGRITREYPAEALRKGAQADFHLRLNVADDGSLEKCTLLNQTLAEGFDMKRHPCTIFQSDAAIEPARKRDGVAVRSFYTTRIVYRMRGNAP